MRSRDSATCRATSCSTCWTRRWASACVTDVPGSPRPASLRPRPDQGHALRRADRRRGGCSCTEARRGLEDVYAADLEPHLAELAHHFSVAAPAGTGQKAFDYADPRRRPSGRPARLRGGRAPLRDGAHPRGRRRGSLRPARSPSATRRRGRATRRAAGVVPRSRRAGRTLGARARAACPRGAGLRRQDHLGGLARRRRPRAAARARRWPRWGRRQPAAGPAAGPAGGRPASRRRSSPDRKSEAPERGARHGRAGSATRARSPMRWPASSRPTTRRLHPDAVRACDRADRRRGTGPATWSGPLRATRTASRRCSSWATADGAKADLAAMAELARELRQPSQDWFVVAYSALMALFEGDLGRPRTLIERARGHG